jgi:hypothetical protein
MCAWSCGGWLPSDGLAAPALTSSAHRRQHEGGLDGSSAGDAASVVAMFAGFYKHLSRRRLVSLLRSCCYTVAEVEVMREAAPEELVRILPCVVPLAALANDAAQLGSARNLPVLQASGQGAATRAGSAGRRGTLLPRQHD